MVLVVDKVLIIFSIKNFKLFVTQFLIAGIFKLLPNASKGCICFSESVDLAMVFTPAHSAHVIGFF